MNQEKDGPQGPEAAATLCAQLAGKFMTFKLASEVYGVPIMKVRELIGLLDITRVPGAPGFVRGVINLRGKVIPVIDLRAKFGLPAGEGSRHNVIIVVQLAAASGQLTMGVLVDEVLEVRNVRSEQIEPPPSFGAAASEVEFILGIGKVEHGVIFLLDIDRVLTNADILRLQLEGGSDEPKS